MEQPTDKQERRRSLGRAFAKFKDVVTRRGSSSKATMTTDAQQSTVEQPQKTEVVSTPTGTTESIPVRDSRPADIAPEESTSEASKDASTMPDASAKAPIVLDSGDVIEVGEEDEPLLPIMSTSTGISAARVRAVFDKYGIKYEAQPENENENEKLRRVEKAIRIRLHWKCHECDTFFGRYKTCANCNHRRCKECSRSPAVKVKDALQGTSQMDQLETQAARAGENQESVLVPVTAEQEAAIAPIDEESLQRSDAAPSKEETAVGESAKEVDASRDDVGSTQPSHSSPALELRPHSVPAEQPAQA